MGEIVGAAVVSHVPPIVMPEALRRELNDGSDFSLVEGLHRLRAECLDRVKPDTVVVFDTHWFTTVEHVLASHERRTGKFTSDELPRGMSQVPYDMPGDPDLARSIESLASGRDDTGSWPATTPISRFTIQRSIFWGSSRAMKGGSRSGSLPISRACSA